MPKPCWIALCAGIPLPQNYKCSKSLKRIWPVYKAKEEQNNHPYMPGVKTVAAS